MRLASPTAALLTLALCGCGGGGSGGAPSPAPPDPPPPPPTGIEVTLNRTPGSSAQLFSAVAQVGAASDRATSLAPVVLSDLTPGNHIVELGSPTADCQIEGDTQQDVTVTDGNLTAVTFDVSCTFTSESRIVFRRFEAINDGLFSIWTIRPDGTDLVQVAPNIALFPSWSIDGTRIAYWDGGQEDGGISIMNWDGTEKTPLSPFNASQATWSPDGTQIVFTACCGETPNVWMMNIDGTGLTQLTTDGQETDVYLRVDWSPDGSMIAFDKSFEMGIIDTNGSLIASLGPGASPHWSPDGSKFIYRGVPPPPAEQVAQIWSMNIDGTDRTQLTDIAPHCGAPTYRSDGAEILFQCPLDTQDPDGVIWRMNADGSSARQFVELPGPISGDADWVTP